MKTTEKRDTIPELIKRQIEVTEQAIQKETDPQRMDALHNRLQKYIELAIEHNKY